ncbi:GAF domain-containing protein [Bradyrhizobium ottawaense]
MPTTLARTFAALSAINEAILYAKSPDELYQKVCDAGFSSGDFLAVAVFLVGPDDRRLHFAAGCGDDVARLRSIEITTVAGTPEGSGVGGEAFRDQKLCVSNDYLNDPRSLAWRAGAASAAIGAAAALPLLCNGKSVGVLYVTRREAGSLNEQMVSLFGRMSANISYALDNFARETARQTSERATRRLNRMFGAISATNEAILRAKTEQELYQLVCDASVHGGKSLATIVLLREPDSHWMSPVASTGQNLALITQARYSIDPENPYGKGISGEVFRTQKAIVEDDLASRTRGSPWEQANVNTGVAACVVAPLIRHGESVGVLLFFISRSWAKDEEIVALLLRMAENVSFAIDNFGRESEKAKIAAEEERLARMYAALSATNEAILRARSRADLFDLVCEATAKGAKFTSANIALVDPHAGLLRVVACYGPNADQVRNFKFSISEEVPEGRGLTGIAFRTRQPAVSNDVLADERIAPWHASARRNGIASSAALPLFNGDRVEGVFLFNSPECGTFTPEFVELLRKLQANVAFALEGFDRAEEKAQVDKQRNRLSGMFEALSATNEAIMRAKTREDLFEAACQAAILGDVFASATIGIIDAENELVRVVAVKGRLQQQMVGRTCSISVDHPEGEGDHRHLAPDSPAQRHERLSERAAVGILAGEGDRGRNAGRRQLPASKGGPGADRHPAFPRARGGHIHARSGRTARAPCRKRVLRARQFRPRRGEGPDRCPEGAPDAHVRGSERDQRSDHAGEVARRAVRARLPCRVERRQVHLDHDRAGQGRQRPAGDRGERRAVFRHHAQRSPLHRPRASRRTRDERHGVPHAPALHQQRLSQRRSRQRIPRRCPRRRGAVGRGISAHRARPGRRRHDLHVDRAGYLHGRVRRAVAASGRQRILCDGEFRSRRREERGGRADRVPRLA